MDGWESRIQRAEITRAKFFTRWDVPAFGQFTKCENDPRQVQAEGPLGLAALC